MVNKKYFKTKDYCKVTFSIDPGQADVVEIVGLNNDWTSPLPMQRGKDGTFTTCAHLPKDSIHEFKYLFDKSFWANDSSADGEVPNPFGTTNSVLSV